MAIRALGLYVLVIMILNAAGWSNTPVLAAVHRPELVLGVQVGGEPSAA